METTTEEWKDIPNFEGLYRVSNFGNVWSLKTNKMMQLVPDKYGSLLISLRFKDKQKQYTLHKLVASVFIPEFNSWSKVTHVDGNKHNNRIDNLKIENKFQKNDQKLKEDEVWKDVERYEGLYQISNYGKVKSFKHRVHGENGVILKPHEYDAYSQYKLSDSNNKEERIPAHRLVATAFIPNPNNYPEVNHKNGVKTDNRVQNLEWCTRQQNIIHMHKVLYPHMMRGRRNPRTGITEEDALRIYELAIKEERTLEDIGEEYGISACAVVDIKVGRTWNYVTKKEYVKNLHPGSKLSDEDVKTIFYLAASGEVSYRTLADMYDLSSSRISDIRNKKAFSDITHDLDDSTIPEKYIEIIDVRKKWRLRAYNQKEEKTLGHKVKMCNDDYITTLENFI